MRDVPPKRARAALQKLLESEGWTYVHHAIEEDVKRAALSLASNPTLSDTEMHFRRGAIYAASRLANLPHDIINQLDVQIRVDEATKD